MRDVVATPRVDYSIDIAGSEDKGPFLGADKKTRLS